MIGRSLVVVLVSIFIFITGLSVIGSLVTTEKMDFPTYLMMLFFGGGAVLPLVFILLCIMNYIIKWRMRSSGIRLDYVYFLIAIPFIVLPIFGFVLFDYSDRGRYFEEKTFWNIAGEYTGYFALSIFIIIINRIIVWRNFRKQKQNSTSG